MKGKERKWIEKEKKKKRKEKKKKQRKKVGLYGKNKEIKEKKRRKEKKRKERPAVLVMMNDWKNPKRFFKFAETLHT